MKKILLTAIVLALGLLTPMTNAEITGVSGLASSTIPAGHETLPAIITPPTDVLNDTVTNTGQQGFNEATVVTMFVYPTDSGGIPPGVLVSSHMIFLNAPTDVLAIAHPDVTWTFSQPILGVMSDTIGLWEFLSTPELGAPGTNYPLGPFPLRGLEVSGQTPPDAYSVSGNEITVSMYVAQPGDWIRVVTCARGSQGFWRNNPEAWPVTEITIGGIPYTKEDAIALMDAPTKGDKTLTMFPQVVAAKLNMMTTGGVCMPACPGAIGTTIAAADAWMAAHPPVAAGGTKVKANSEAWKEGEPLYEELDNFNNEGPCPEPV